MTCSECSNQIPDDTTTCSHCGAPVEIHESPAAPVPPIAASSPAPGKPQQVEEGQDTPRMWEPALICILTLPILGSLVGSVLIGMNWHRLKQKTQAIIALCFSPCWFLIALVVPLPANQTLVSIIAYGLWFIVLGLPQIRYFQKHFPAGHLKRSWVIPVVAGLGISVAQVLLYPK